MWSEDDLCPEVRAEQERRKTAAARAHSSRNRQAPPPTQVQTPVKHTVRCPECNKLIQLDEALTPRNNSPTNHRNGLHRLVPLCTDCTSPRENCRPVYFYPRT